MTDLAKLKEATEALIERASQRAEMTASEEIAFDMGLDDISEAWEDVANPATILALISRLEAAEGERDRLRAKCADQMRSLERLQHRVNTTTQVVADERNTLRSQRDEAVGALRRFGSGVFQDMPAGYPVQVSWTDGVNRGFSHNWLTTDHFRHAAHVVSKLGEGHG